MIKRMLALEVLLAVGIVSVTAGITQLAPLLNHRGVALNLGTTMAKALEQADITVANDFRYVHVKLENNMQLASQHFGGETSADMKLWGYNRNARMDVNTINSAEGYHKLNMLIMGDNDIGCLAGDGYYECEDWPEINMEALTDNTSLTISDVRVDDTVMSFWTRSALPDNTQIELSIGSSGYSDAGTTIELGHTEQQKYYYLIDLKTLGELTHQEDLNAQTVQFQLESIQGDNKPALESPVFEWNKTTNLVQQLTASDLVAVQHTYAERLKAQRAAEPGMMERFLDDGPFSIIKRLQDEKVDLNAPVEQSSIHYNGKLVRRVMYAFPVEYEQSNLERYVEIILDPATETIFEYTLLDERKGMVSRVTFLENKVITDIDPAIFFAEEYWQKELRLTKGENPNLPPLPEAPDNV